ncbi:MAG: hypothetical protein LLG06_01855, partial [Desulfobacteraceae bacterium]|nr:hypothetical protein [Desulfobacteraceae bacterium]
PAAQESDTISELIASPVPKNFDLEKVERRIRETAGPAQKQILSILDKHGISPIMGPRFELACDILLKGDMLTSGLIHSGGKVLAQDYAEIMGCQPIAKSEGELPVITAFEEFMAMARDSTLAAMGCENYAIN